MESDSPSRHDAALPYRVDPVFRLVAEGSANACEVSVTDAHVVTSLKDTHVVTSLKDTGVL